MVYALRQHLEADLSESEASIVYRERVLGQLEQHRDTLSWSTKNNQKTLQVLAPFSVPHNSILTASGDSP